MEERLLILPVNEYKLHKDEFFACASGCNYTYFERYRFKTKYSGSITSAITIRPGGNALSAAAFTF